MKVLFTADIHLKLGQKNVPIDWSMNRYRLLFAQLSDLSTTVDLTILGGDIFDKVPSVEEMSLYFELVACFKSKTIIYSGNHEAIKKDTTFLTYLKAATTKLNPLVSIIDDYHRYEGIDFIPYNKLKAWEKSPEEFLPENRVLCTHVRGEIPPHVKPEINLELFSKWDMVLAGDLHSHDNCQRNIVYPGSPVTTSFHRNRVSTGVIIVTLTKDIIWEFQELEVPQLIRKNIIAGEPMPAGSYDHIIYEVEGDISQLSGIETTGLLDKKITKRSVDTALILHANMSLLDEVKEYLTYILELPEPVINKVLSRLNKYGTTRD